VNDQLQPLAALFNHKQRVPSIHWIGGWVGPIANLDVVAKGKYPWLNNHIMLT